MKPADAARVAATAQHQRLRGLKPAQADQLRRAMQMLQAGDAMMSGQLLLDLARSAPEHPVAWNGIGLILVDLNKYADARNAFARAIQANPDFAEAHHARAVTRLQLGNYAQGWPEHEWRWKATGSKPRPDKSGKGSTVDTGTRSSRGEDSKGRSTRSGSESGRKK